MAPPSRRSGHSRKAQFNIFGGYVLAVIGALIGAGLLVISLLQPGAFSGLRGAATDVTRPVGNAGAVARDGGTGFFDAIRGYYRAGSANARLREENELARIRLAEGSAVAAENRRLKELLGLFEGETRPIATARLVGATSSSTRRFAYLGAGANRGVTVGMPVRSERGIVGRVLEVGRLTSRVLMLNDSESVVPVRLAGGDAVAFAEGRGDGQLRIRLVNLGLNPIKKGDVFVTSGSGGLYRPGIAVAVATEILPDGALARMVANPAGTEYVVVEQVWQPDVRREAARPVGEPVEGGDLPAGANGGLDAESIAAGATPTPTQSPSPVASPSRSARPSPPSAPTSAPSPETTATTTATAGRTAPTSRPSQEPAGQSTPAGGESQSDGRP